MELILRILTTLTGPAFAKWLVATVAGLCGLTVVLVARRRGRAQGRAEVRAENARARARRQADLNALRDAQMKTSNSRPDADGLDKILEEGRF